MPKIFKEFWTWLSNFDALRSLWVWVPTSVMSFVATIWAKIEGFPPSMLFVLFIFCIACLIVIFSFIVIKLKRYRARNLGHGISEQCSDQFRDTYLLDAVFFMASGNWDSRIHIGYTSNNDLAYSVLKACKEIQQPAYDGVLDIFGKEGESNLYVKIEKDYWSDHVIDISSLLKGIEKEKGSHKGLSTRKENTALKDTELIYRSLKTSKSKIEELYGNR